MRVIYIGNTSDVYQNIINGGDVVLYITGGATRNLLEKAGHSKYMTSPADSRATKKRKLSCRSDAG